MDNPQTRVEQGWRYDQAAESALALERLLAKHSIRVQPGSALERHVLSVLDLVDRKRAGAVNVKNEDIRPLYRTLIGVHELASLLLKVQDNPQFAALVPHLRLLNEGEALQDSPSGVDDQATNKLFELYMGAVALQCGRGVELDIPPYRPSISHSRITKPATDTSFLLVALRFA